MDLVRIIFGNEGGYGWRTLAVVTGHASGQPILRGLALASPRVTALHVLTVADNLAVTQTRYASHKGARVITLQPWPPRRKPRGDHP